MARKKETPEEIEIRRLKSIEDDINRQKNELIQCCNKGFVSEPTRIFEIGEEVISGNHLQTKVIDRDLNNKIYFISHYYIIGPGSQDSGKIFSEKRWVLWVDLEKKMDYSKIPIISKRDELDLTYYQSSISSFHSIIYHFGIDLNPEYQRELVWDLNDKIKLIDSIFDNIDIGKFVFVKRPYSSSEHMFEILDGKQRFSTIIEFWEDRFSWRGLKFSDLHPRDKNHFENYRISKAEFNKPNDINILYKLFLKLNTSGKPIEQKHLDKVKNLIK